MESIAVYYTPLKGQPTEPSDSSVVELLFYVHGKHLRSCRDGQLT